MRMPMERSKDLVPDVSGLQAEARGIVERAAEAFLTHLQNDLVSLVAHGSAVKGDYVPGCSDVDLVLIVRPGTLATGGHLPFATVAALQFDLSGIEIAPFRYLQSRVEEQGRPRKGGFVPGAYHLVWGEPNVPLATPEQLRGAAREALIGLDIRAMEARICDRLLDCGEGRFDREVRYICTDVWPRLYCMLIVDGCDPLEVWRMTKSEAIAATNERSEAGKSVRDFYEAVVRHYTRGEAVETGMAVLELGLRFLRAVSERARSSVR